MHTQIVLSMLRFCVAWAFFPASCHIRCDICAGDLLCLKTSLLVFVYFSGTCHLLASSSEVIPESQDDGCGSGAPFRREHSKGSLTVPAVGLWVDHRIQQNVASLVRVGHMCGFFFKSHASQ